MTFHPFFRTPFNKGVYFYLYTVALAKAYRTVALAKLCCTTWH